MKNLVIVGAGEFGRMADEYFATDSQYSVAGFAVEREYMKETEMNGLPIVPLESITDYFGIDNHDVFVAITYVNGNRVRERLMNCCRELGYELVSFVSSKASVSPSVTIGSNVMIMENASLQFNVNIGDGAIVWNGVNISHGTKIGKCCWIAPAAAIAGLSQVDDRTFVGVNATVKDEIKIASDNLIGAGAVGIKDINDSFGTYVGCPAHRLK